MYVLQLEKLLLKDHGHFLGNFDGQNGRESDMLKKQHENYHQARQTNLGLGQDRKVKQNLIF
ncbi:hypothetical protein MUK42_34565 [Musa troglodytarum]|uniref:Uncharacterized protein n=1 Tax=Musa troglodytarum TaxID=320322 RepID=A0A9E7EI56_9LILI|nr:hypothetical protein MUK42_34565 [Musa troglodytarum]